MNSRTAKLINRVAKSELIKRKMKALWYATPWNRRNQLRKYWESLQVYR